MKNSYKLCSALMAILMFVCSYLAVPAQVLADGLALQDAVRAYNTVSFFSRCQFTLRLGF